VLGVGGGDGTGRQATDENTIRCLLIACWLPKATNTHLECIIIIAFSRQHLLHGRSSQLHYTYSYIACLAVLTASCLYTKMLISQHFTEYIGFLRSYQLETPSSQVMNLFTQFIDSMDWESALCKAIPYISLHKLMS
jgi:hypothetical protein